MRLETKLGFSTGVLITAMVLVALTAQLRIQDANQISGAVTEKRVPTMLQIRDARLHMMRSIGALESYMLFRTSAEASASYREERRRQMDDAEESVNALYAVRNSVELREDGARLDSLRTDFQRLRQLEEQVEALNESHQPQAVKRRV